MKKIDLGQTIQILANVGVIAGIIFLGIEIRGSTMATQAASIQAVAALDQQFLSGIGADPELSALWSTYMLAPETLSDEQKQQGDFLLTSVLRRLENVYIQYELGTISDASWQSRQDLFVSVARSRGFSAYLDSVFVSYSNQEFLEFMNGLR